MAIQKVARLGALRGAALNDAKVVLADEATALLHGPACLTVVHRTARSLFSGGGGGAGRVGSGVSVGGVDLPRWRAPAGGTVVDALVGLGLAATRSEARRLVAGGGARVGGEPCGDGAALLPELAPGGEVLVSAGKKRHGVVEGPAEQ